MCFQFFYGYIKDFSRLGFILAYVLKAYVLMCLYVHFRPTILDTEYDSSDVLEELLFETQDAFITLMFWKFLTKQ